MTRASLGTSEAALRAALEAHDAVIARQGVARLPDLDHWYRHDLPAALAERRPAYVDKAELVRLTEWKMARGVWRAPNLVLVRSNDPKVIEEVSAAALAQMPHPTAPIATLTQLKGVGPATASAVTAVASPDVYPFFDETVAAQLPGLGTVAWTLSCYARYAEALREVARALGSDWTPALLEQALWAHGGGKSRSVPAKRS